jgi:hypothetical protein
MIFKKLIRPKIGATFARKLSQYEKIEREFKISLSHGDVQCTRSEILRFLKIGNSQHILNG